MRSLLGIGAAAVAALMVCCGGSTASSGSDGGSDARGGSGSSSGGASSSGSSGAGSSSSSSGGGVSPCPPSPPSSGTTCMPEGVQCEYGTNPNPACNEIVECQSGTWAGGGAGMMCPSGPCPTSYADVSQGQTCTPEGLDCPYPQGQCNCSQTSPAGTSTMPAWHCFGPQGCPEPRPTLGAPCTQDGLSCDYGACTGGLAETCMGGYWQQQGVACPG